MKMQNRFGNWWYEDDVCRKDGCNTLINSCDNRYSIGMQGNFEPKRILDCRDHYYSEMKKRDVLNNPRRNAISKIAYKIAGGAATFYKKPKDERLLFRKEATKRYLLNERPADEVLEFIFPKKESSVIRTTVRNEKTRNYGLRAPLIRMYNHECQVESCHETEVEVSHVLAHHLKDSVDDETNVRLFCVTHHRAYDGGRMLIDDNNKFVRYNHHGKLIETGRVIYDDRHEINPTFARRTREHHESRKEQAMD